jgi:hypothetical protein
MHRCWLVVYLVAGSLLGAQPLFSLNPAGVRVTISNSCTVARGPPYRSPLLMNKPGYHVEEV